MSPLIAPKTDAPATAIEPENQPAQSSAAWHDLLLLATLGAAVFALAQRFALFERLVTIGRRLDDTGGDALIVTILVLVFAIKVFAWRRWVELRRALAASTRAEAALRETAARMRLLQDQLPAHLWTTDANLRLTAFAGGGFVGREAEIRARLGLTLQEFFRTDAAEYAPIEAHRRALTGEATRYEIAVAGRNYVVYVEPLRDASGMIVGCQGLGVDVTEREGAVAALRDSEAHLRAIVDHAAIGIVIADTNRRILRANPAYERLLGYTEAELQTMTFPSATHPDYAEADQALFGALVAGKRDTYQIEKRYRRKDGAGVWGRLTVSLVRSGTGAPEYTIGMVEDVTALATARRRMTTTREEERLALARELHDEAIQELLGISLALQLGRRALDSESADPVILALLDEGQRTLRDVMGRLRRIVSGLRPAGLEELGLVAAIEGYAAHIRRKEAATGLAITLDLDPTGACLPPAIARALFRVTQEGLRNVRRHAGAHHATVTLRIAAAGATLRVADDGCGFAPPPDLTALARTGHFGLIGLPHHHRSRRDAGDNITAGCGHHDYRARTGDDGGGARCLNRSASCWPTTMPSFVPDCA